MLVGVFVHTKLLGTSELFQLIAYLSSQFRMEAFFLLSGFFTCLQVRKYGVASTMKFRYRTLGVPVLAGLLVLNPATLLLIYEFHNVSGAMGFWEAMRLPYPNDFGPMVWHLHFWFLFPLLVFVSFLPVIDAVDKRLTGKFTVVADRFNGKYFYWSCVFSVPILVILALATYRLAFDSIVPSQVSWLVSKVVISFPFFLGGYGLYRYVIGRGLELSFHPVCLGGSILALVAVNTWSQNEILYWRIIRAGAEAFFEINAALFLVYFVERFFASANRTVRSLSDSAYTVYVFHFLVIYTIGTVCLKHPTNSTTQLIVISILAWLACIAIHNYAIARVPLLGYLFNGKRRRDRVVQGTESRRRPLLARLGL